MNILLTGASGFIGTALRECLPPDACVFGLTRQPAASVAWTNTIPIASVAEIDQPLDTVINLAGENIGSQRWTQTRRQQLRDSRIVFTERLGRALHQQGQRPAVWINASAVGYYGDRPDAEVDEQQPPGKDFAAQLCADWETAATEPAAELGVARLCVLRLGVVIGPGGMLTKLRLPFSLGMGAVMGPGPQHMAWVSHADAVRVLLQAIRDDTFHGVYNVVAPEAVSQRRFADAFAQVLRRPRLLQLPAPILRLLMGQMADLLLFDQHVIPRKLRDLGFEFEHPQLVGALRAALR